MNKEKEWTMQEYRAFMKIDKAEERKFLLLLLMAMGLGAQIAIVGILWVIY